MGLTFVGAIVAVRLANSSHAKPYDGPAITAAQDHFVFTAGSAGIVSFVHSRRKKSTKNQLKRSRRAFTLVELLTTVAIVAILSVALIFFTMSYVQWAQNVSDQRTLLVLNDALNRYKCEGGNVTALTSGTPTGHVITALKTPVNWAGTTHQFMLSNLNIIGHSLSATGNGANYCFTAYNTYTDKPGGSSPTVQIFLTTTGARTWTVPADWNSSYNTIECIGGGGNGISTSAGGAGGGGAYAKSTNISLAPGGTASYQVGGTAAATWFNATSLANAQSNGSSVSCAADYGRTATSATGGVGGLAANSVGALATSGSSGGGGMWGDHAGGGAGAGGPNGNGGNGGGGAGFTGAWSGGGGGSNGGSDGRYTVTFAGAGGNNRFGTGHGVGAIDPSTPATAGTNGGGGGAGYSTAGIRNGATGGTGTEWDSTHGSGGGGGGGFNGGSGGGGGLYGGGGGGQGGSSGGGGVGAQGIIVITYTP